jgi:uncharacterized membrane protein YeiH
MRRELYMTPILLGGALHVTLREATALDPGSIAWLVMFAIVAVRLGAIRWGWAFPDWLTYKPLK